MFYVTFNGKPLTAPCFGIDNALDYARDLATKTAKHLNADEPLYNQRLTAYVVERDGKKYVYGVKEDSHVTSI